MADDPIKIMLVDDSAVIRGFLFRAIGTEKDMQVVCVAADGQAAVEQAKRHEIDVIVLDIEMPRMDGLTAIPLLMAASPGVKIVMASTLTQRNAEISFRALQAGAADYLTKPEASGLAGNAAFNRSLIEKIRALGAAARRDRRNARPSAVWTRQTASFKLQKLTSIKPKAIAIGSSTGGPQALFQVLRALRGVSVPILLTQHMPPTFTTILADHIRKQCEIDAVEAQHGMVIKAGRVHVAAGDYHMTIGGDSHEQKIMLTRDAPENFCRPSVDVMLRSMVASYGPKILTIILTGMGKDGLVGCRLVNEGGGVVIAQDEASSVVWGMPGAVATDGICAAVLPIRQIGTWAYDYLATTPAVAR